MLPFFSTLTLVVLRRTCLEAFYGSRNRENLLTNDWRWGRDFFFVWRLQRSEQSYEPRRFRGSSIFFVFGLDLALNDVAHGGCVLLLDITLWGLMHLSKRRWLRIAIQPIFRNNCACPCKLGPQTYILLRGHGSHLAACSYRFLTPFYFLFTGIVQRIPYDG